MIRSLAIFLLLTAAAHAQTPTGTATNSPRAVLDPAEERKLAAQDLAEGRTADALSRATRLVEASDQDPANRILLARASLQAADAREADGGVDDLVRSLWIDADTSAAIAASDASLAAEAGVIQAFVKDRRGDRPGAIAALDAIVAQHPDHADALALRGFLRLKTGAHAGALADLDAAMKLAPERLDIRINHATARVIDSPDAAANEFAEISRSGKADAGLASDVYQALSPHPAACVAALSAIAGSVQAGQDAWGWLGRAQIDAGQPAAAIKSFDRALEGRESDGTWRAFRAEARAKVNDIDAMIEDLSAVIDSNAPERAWAMTKMYSTAAWCAEQDRYDRVEVIARKLVAAAPEQPAARANLALALAKLNRVEESERSYREAMRDFPADPSLENDFALFLEGTGRSNEARDQFRAAIDHKSIDAVENLATLRVHAAESADARAGFLQVLAGDPRRLRAILGLARTYSTPASTGSR